jgi:small GTP-binding protein
MIAKKVLLVGNFGVGKTSLIRRFVSNEFSEDYISTIGVRISAKVMEFSNQSIKLLIWDVAGTKDNEKVPKAYFLGASAAMYVFDLSREETYQNLEANLEMVKELSGMNKIAIVGNKKDLLTAEELVQVTSSINLKIHFLTSAKENLDVEKAFDLLAETSLT